jgi:hypothetical protein
MGSITLDQNLASNLANSITKVERLLAANLNVSSGEKFTLLGKEINSEHARFDYIRFVPVTSLSSVTIEAESIANRSGYRLESIRAASGRSVLSLMGGAANETGSATFAFSGATGFYNVILGTFDENDGSSTFSLNRNDSGVVTISGTSTQGQTLTAMVADGDGLPATINYQWQQSSDGTNWSAISGATARTLTLQQAQVGQRVRAIASYRDLLGASESITSTPTTVAALHVNAPGGVSISGTPTQGQILTATVADADGLPATINYQWQQSSDGTTWSAITGATARTLTLQQAQVGQRVRAIASYVDQRGGSETLTSAPTTAAVLNRNDPGVVSISGTPTQGQILTASVADADGLPGTINYQWQRSSDGTTWSAIAGATGRTLTLQQEQVGQRVRAIASYVDLLGASEALTSAPTTAAVLNVNDTGVVSISGTPTQGQLLTATVADPDGLPATIDYQWQQSSNGSTWSNITGAVGRTLTLQQAQGGQQVRVNVTYTDALGTPESNRVSTPLLISSTVAPQPVYLSDLTPTVSINGWGPYERDISNGENAPNDGRTLTINGTTYAKGLGVHASSSLTYSLGGLYSRFQSFIGIDDEVLSTRGSVIFRVLADGAEIFRSGILTGASDPQFVNLDVTGRQTLQLIVDTADGSASWDKADWADAKLLFSGSPATPLPSITLGVSPASVTEDGTPILIYTFTRTGSTTTALSVNYTVAGTATNGTDYTGIASTGTIYTVSFAAGSATATVTVNPTADSTGEADETVVLTLAAGSGYRIGTSSAVTGTITNDDQAVITPPPPSSTAYLSDLTPTVSINGWGPYERDLSNGESAPNDGRTLTINGITYAKGLGVHASSSLTYTIGGLYSRFQSFIGIDDEVASTNGSVIFRVLADGVEVFRSGTLTGATDPQYVDLDIAGRQSLQLIVDTADGSASWDKADWADAKLIRIGTTGVNRPGTISLTGTPTQGQALTATVADGDGLPATINYQWQQSSNGTTWSVIAGATGRTLTLQQAQVGQRVRAIASYVDPLGASEALTSAPTTAAVLNVNDPGVVSISGTPTQGQLLTATVADADGLPATINYQWQQSSNGTTWSAIAGATGRTLTLQQAQVGQRVRAISSYVDQLGSSESLTSMPTTAVVVGGTLPPSGGTLSLPLEAWWGGPAYYANFPTAAAAGWTDPSFFPIGVFYGKPSHAAQLRQVGINTYMRAEYDGSSVTSMTDTGMFLILQPEWTAAQVGNNPRVVGWHVSEEVDMAPGTEAERLAIHTAEVARRRALNDGRFMQANFGNGVLGTWWSPNIMDDLIASTDVTTVDKYAYTSPDVRFEYGRTPYWPSGQNPDSASAYGWQQDRMELLGSQLNGVATGVQKPNWVFVETARPFLTEAGAETIRPEEIEGAVWNSLINGASGVAYFQHNNDATNGTYSLVTGDPDRLAKVTEINAQVQRMAPVLNSQPYQWNFGTGLDTSLRVYNGDVYILAMTDGGTGVRTFTLPPGVSGAQVEVVDEGRTLTVTNGTFTDTFAAEHTHHIYRISLR